MAKNNTNFMEKIMSNSKKDTKNTNTNFMEKIMSNNSNTNTNKSNTNFMEKIMSNNTNNNNTNFMGETMNNKKNNNSTIITTLKEGYEAKVIYEALKRAGKNPHIKGHIHEILVRDGINYNPLNILDGKTATLVKNPTAKTVDLVVKKGGKIVERLQLKDTPNSINSVLRQIKSGHYNSAKIVATEETAKELVKKAGEQGIKKTIKSSGISTKTTTRLAQKAGAKGSGTIIGAVGDAAKSGAKFGGGVSAGIAVAGGVVDMINGDKDLADVTADVIIEGTKGAIVGGGAAMATTAIGATAGGAAIIAAAPILAPIGIAIGVGTLLSSIFDW